MRKINATDFIYDLLLFICTKFKEKSIEYYPHIFATTVNGFYSLQK